MKEQKDDKWLDEIISCTINTEKPEFDAQKWKKEYPGELKILQSRASETPAHSIRWTNILKNPIVKFAAAAAVIIIVLNFFPGREKLTPNKSTTETQPASQSPTKMISMISMRITYQRGGFEALDEQFDNTLKMLGPQLSKISMQELLEGVNGS